MIRCRPSARPSRGWAVLRHKGRAWPYGVIATGAQATLEDRDEVRTMQLRPGDINER
jgi:hypothetical protein